MDTKIMKKIPIPLKLYLHKDYILEDDKAISCRSIYTARQSENDIEYIINNNYIYQKNYLTYIIKYIFENDVRIYILYIKI